MERQKRLDCEGYRARHLHLLPSPESVFGPMFFFQNKHPVQWREKLFEEKLLVLLGVGDVFQPLGGIDYFYHCYPF